MYVYDFYFQEKHNIFSGAILFYVDYFVCCDRVRDHVDAIGIDYLW